MAAGAAPRVFGESLFGQAIEPAGLGVALDLLIEARGIERLEPVGEICELVGRQVGDGLFEVFDGHKEQLMEKRVCHRRTLSFGLVGRVSRRRNPPRCTMNGGLRFVNLPYGLQMTRLVRILSEEWQSRRRTFRKFCLS